MVCNLVLIYFDCPQLCIQQKQTIKNFRLLIQRYGQLWFFRKGSGNTFSTTFCVWFFKKSFCHVIFYSLTKFHCLIVFNFWDIDQYMYCNCLLPRLWRHKLWNWLYFSNQAFFLHDLNVNTKFSIGEIKKASFIIFKGLSVAINCLRL